MGRPKGSKNKASPKQPKTGQNSPKKGQNSPVKPQNKPVRGRPRKILAVAPVTPKIETLCCICGRVLWGERQPLGFGKVRHKYSCAPGSNSWAEYYAALPHNQKTEEGNIILAHYNKQEETC